MNIRLTENFVITNIQKHVKFQKSAVNHSIDTSRQESIALFDRHSKQHHQSQNNL